MCKYVLVLCLFIGFAGCGSMDVYKDDKGNDHTKLTDVLNITSRGVGAVSSFIPVYGAVGAGVAGLISLVSNGLLAVAKRRKEGVISTMVAGVNEATKNFEELKKDLITILSLTSASPDVANKANQVLTAFEENGKRVKDVIAAIAEGRNLSGTVLDAVRRNEG